MGLGLARPIRFRDYGPRPGPAFFQVMGRGPVRPGLSNYGMQGRGLARLITLVFFTARLGPAR